MVFFTDYFQHRTSCNRKQSERAHRRTNLPLNYLTPINDQDRAIYDKRIDHLVHDVQHGIIQPTRILEAYGKKAMLVHDRTNCLTEIMLPEAERFATTQCNLKGPLAGIPVSLKDSINVAGFETSVGYSSTLDGNVQQIDGPLVRLLKEAGAVPFVKTNLPITLLSFESANDVWGRSKNPHNTSYSPGGSTGGEGALLAGGGSRIGIGSDVAGSVRAPAAWSGCYSLRCSTGRWPKSGVNTSMPGQEGIPSVFSPMTRTLDDLVYFTRNFIKTKPWRLDHSVHPLDWRDQIEQDTRRQAKFRIGVLATDGVIDPSPACARALQETVQAMKLEGHEIVYLDSPNVVPPPSPYEGFQIAAPLLNSDGCRTFASYFRTGEWMDTGARQMKRYMQLPRFVKYVHYLWVRYIRQDPLWAGLLYDWHEKSAFEQWKLVAKREAYRARWHAWWQEEAKLDFILTPPNATPALPHDAMHDAVSNCNYTFLWNLLDYTAGIVPVSHVSAELDALPKAFKVGKLNGIARGAYMHYDAQKMSGLPLAVQVVGQRLSEEKVLAAMCRIEDALEKHNGGKYELLDIE